MKLAEPAYLHPPWLLLISYIGGIVTASSLAQPYLQYLTSNHLIAALLATTLLAMLVYKKRLISLLTLAAIFFTLGNSLYIHAINPPATNIDLTNFQHKKVDITATICHIDPQAYKWRMDVAMENISLHQASSGKSKAVGKLRVQVVPQHARVHQTASNIQPSSINNPTNLLPGDRISFTAKLRQPRRFYMPGEFDYPQYLAQYGIFNTAYVKDKKTTTDNNHNSAAHPNLQRLNTSGSNLSVTTLIERWRCLLGRKIYPLFQPTDSAYLLSLTLGQKSRLSTLQRNTLAAYGISHLFSISGLHLGLLALLCYQLILCLYKRSEKLLLWLPAQTAAMALTLPPVFFYLILSGTALPTIRAALLLAIGMFSIIYQRHTPTFTLLPLIALLILLHNPIALFTASFQLSFAGVCAIVFFAAKLAHHCHSTISRWFILPIITTLIATLATAPIALYHFHTFAPAAIICNVIAIPLIGMVVVPLALCATMLFPIIPGIATPVLQMTIWLINLVLSCCKFIANGILAGKPFYLTPLQHLLIAGICLTILFLLVQQWRSSLATGTICLAFLCLLYCQPAPPPLQLTPFSIGQGDSLLLQLGRHKTYLIDGGGIYSKTFDVGQRLLAPALGYLGIQHLDAIILSHDHPDHRKGLIYILQHFNVDNFWSSIPLQELHFTVQQVLHNRQIPFRLFNAGWTPINTHHSTLAIFVPPDQQAKMNDRSLVVYAGYKKDGILLTGDLEKHGIEQLLQQSLPGEVNLLKLPHHGSRYSLPQRLLKTIHPDIAVANVGYHNRYHFPHRQVIDAVKHNNATLFRTDLDGTVRFSSFGSGWITTELDKP